MPKNCTVNVVLAMLFSVPWTPPVTPARTGKFCRLFGAGVGVAGVVRRHASRTEIDAEAAVAEDGVAQYRVARPGVHEHAGQAVVRDDVGGAGRVPPTVVPVPSRNNP